jgi:hypothetical protein
MQGALYRQTPPAPTAAPNPFGWSPRSLDQAHIRSAAAVAPPTHRTSTGRARRDHQLTREEVVFGTLHPARGATAGHREDAGVLEVSVRGDAFETNELRHGSKIGTARGQRATDAFAKRSAVDDADARPDRLNHSGDSVSRFDEYSLLACLLSGKKAGHPSKRFDIVVDGSRRRGLPHQGR